VAGAAGWMESLIPKSDNAEQGDIKFNLSNLDDVHQTLVGHLQWQDKGGNGV
jgi:hypothetical protein